MLLIYKIYICISLASPVFTHHPESVVTFENENIELFCIANGTKPIMFHWEKFNSDDTSWEPLPSNASFAGMNSKAINSINIQQSDEGSYRCRANNSAGTSISNVANITVYGEL